MIAEAEMKDPRWIILGIVIVLALVALCGCATPPGMRRHSYIRHRADGTHGYRSYFLPSCIPRPSNRWKARRIRDEWNAAADKAWGKINKAIWTSRAQ